MFYLSKIFLVYQELNIRKSNYFLRTAENDYSEKSEEWLNQKLSGYLGNQSKIVSNTG
jgi:hypothetical protein